MRLFRSIDDARSQSGVIELRHDGEIYRVQLRRVDTARRFILRVRGATRDAVLTIPRRASLKDAAEFAERNAAWVGVRIRRLPQQLRFIDAAVFPLRGVPTRIVHAPGARGVVWLVAGSASEPKLYVAGDSAHIERRVQDWLKAQARIELLTAVARYAETIGKPTPPI